MSATQKVFGVFELLEAILLNLPIKDLLFAQKISKNFNQVIKSSTPLQKALFFQPGNLEDAAVDAKIHYLDTAGRTSPSIRYSLHATTSALPTAVHASIPTAQRRWLA
jgi:hypothetical protein